MRSAIEFRDQPDAADEVEAAKLGLLESDRKIQRDEDGERQPDHQRQAGPECREPAAGATLPAPRPPAERDRGDDAKPEGKDDRAGPFAGRRRRQDDPAIVEKNFAEQRDALARARQRAEHGEIPEQDLEQERQVANELDITAGEPRQEPIGRQSRNADEEADHGRQHDADPGHQQRVEQAHEEHAAVGVRFVIGNERLVDAEAGDLVEEAEAARDVLRVEIGLGVERELVAEPQHRREQYELIDNGAGLGVVVDRDPRRSRAALAISACVSIDPCRHRPSLGPGDASLRVHRRSRLRLDR